MNASLSDKRANSLLDFIAIRESAGNYDAYIGCIKGDRDLSRFTISDVYNFQRRLVAAGEPSSAVGRYQFVQKTLSGLVQQHGIATDERFTPAVQDYLGYELLVTRGYMKWVAGVLDDDGFMHNLSCEWASLPDPNNGGKSHYDGDGVNHAGQTLEAVQAALDAARNVTV